MILSIPAVDPDITNIVRITKKTTKARNWVDLMCIIHDGQKSDNSTAKCCNNNAFLIVCSLNKIRCVYVNAYTLPALSI